MEEGRNITGHLISTTYKVSLILLLPTFPFKSDRIFKLLKSFVNDLNYYDYTGELAENKEEESGKMKTKKMQ